MSQQFFCAVKVGILGANPPPPVNTSMQTHLLYRCKGAEGYGQWRFLAIFIWQPVKNGWN